MSATICLQATSFSPSPFLLRDGYLSSVGLISHSFGSLRLCLFQLVILSPTIFSPEFMDLKLFGKTIVVSNIRTLLGQREVPIQKTNPAGALKGPGSVLVDMDHNSLERLASVALV